MKNKCLFSLIAMLSVILQAPAVVPGSNSFYKSKPSDPDAVYFTPAEFKITNDGKMDVTEALQGAINKLKLEQNFGIIFIPEGTYTISRTIYIPAAIRIIGYGRKRPVFVLRKNTPGYQEPVVTDKGKANYMFWFTSSVVEPGKPVNDAGAGTFYSALSNVDIVIEDGNPYAVALRTHYAQHSFVAHCDVHVGKGKAGLFDIGNYMEDVRFFGGDYGIYTTKASPGWQFMMVDTWFEGQRKAAIKTQQAGLTIVRMNVKNVPKVIDVDPDFWEKLYMEDCQLINIAGPVVSFENEGNDVLQINMRNITCRNVPLVAEYQRSKTYTRAPGNIYRINRYVYGLQMDDINAEQEFKTVFEHELLADLPSPVASDIPLIQSVDSWVNLKDLGAKGDGSTDDTKIIRDAVEKYNTIYFPQGLYRVTGTIKLKPETVLIGLHPIATQIILGESTPAFSGFGSPVPLVETAPGSNNIISGIGLFTGEYNYRAVACKWTGGERSMLEDVKFVGGHGTMRKGPYVPWAGYGDQTRKPQPVPGPDPAWDTQYWSLWVTNEGGGIFKNIWTASSYACSGIYVSNTSTVGKIYAMSVEHHVRNEVRFNKVSNWKIYALQLEEESREGVYCQPMEISNCSNLMFANLYMFRVIRFKTPYPYSIRTWDCKNVELLNVHNYSQIKYTTDNPLYDINTNTEVRPSELARLFISGKVPLNSSQTPSGQVMTLARGFEFAEGMCSDSKGNIYFSEQRLKRIYKWSAATASLDLLADYPWEPLSLGCDSEDNLLVVFKYFPQFGHKINGVQESFRNPPDASGTSFSMWGNSGFATLTYSIDPDDPDETLEPLKRNKMGSLPVVHKALHPSNRWRDFHDFDKVTVNRNEECWLAPDGKTIIPICYDLARSSGLVEAFPGKQVYVSNEYDKRTVKLDVDDNGYVTNMQRFAEKGEFFSVPAANGDVYIADGDLFVFNHEGKLKGTIHIPERLNAISFGGKGKETLFVTGREALYSVAISQQPAFKVLVLTERGGQHEGFVKPAIDWLEEYSRAENFEITVINTTDKIDEAYLSDFKVFIQLDYIPYAWPEKAMKAFVRYIEEGRGGWVGFHHATLLGEFDGYPMWPWFSDFMGGIRFKNYIAQKASGKIILEDGNHPVMKGVSESFVLHNDEWYTFDKSPRPNVKVLATVDESSYDPPSDIKMGDHPVVWVNEKVKARNVYFLMGHDGSLFHSKDFTTMFSNAIKWASGE
ncbi:MAG: ThuA domain-containing protein [Bacteroidales bacterium]|jgi:type 1 glutamine amidotransferase